MNRTALVVTVPTAGDEYESLEEFARYADQVAQGLQSLGYLVNEPTDTWHWTAKEINQNFQELVDCDDVTGVRVMHILGHGEGKTGTVFPIGADGKIDDDCDIANWLKRVQSTTRARPVTLFILDTCHSGQATLTDWGPSIHAEDLRGWVLAASEPHRSAYDGRLSHAVANQLAAIANQTMGLAPDVEFVPWATFRDKIIDEVENREVGVVLPQRVTSTLLNRTVTVPFFPNPAYKQVGPLQEAKNEAGQGLGPFLDSFTDTVTPIEEIAQGLDPDHFTERVRGRAGLGRDGTFTGRRSQLGDLSSWINDPDSADTVRVVTGSPGVGKSALLGVVVCAAHPFLRVRTESLWSRAAATPNLQPNMAAIHVRALPLGQVLMSIGHQLSLQTPIDGWTTSSLVGALSELPESPLIVFDAVDEADNMHKTVELLRELTNARRRDSTPVCRLLVGTRAGECWPIIQNWMDQLPASQKTDLDAVPLDILREDLVTYLTSIFGHGRFNRQLAEGIARHLTYERGKTRGWGEFLVASLFAVWVLQHGIPQSENEVENLLAHAPGTLPDILEFDLSFGGDALLRRSILACLSWSKGTGMPLRVLRLLTRQVFAPGLQITDSDFTRALDQVRFYLRTNTDSNGELLRRPFHQGLIDHLWTGAIAISDMILESLLGDRPIIEGRRSWGTAEPYLIRHALEHAIDAHRAMTLLSDDDYIVHADPDSLLATLDRLENSSEQWREDVSQRQRNLAAVYRQSLPQHRALTPGHRQQILQVDRARFRVEHILTRLHEVAADGQVVWRIEWATGTTVSSQLRTTISTVGPVTALACTVLSDETPVAVVGRTTGEVELWDLGHGILVGAPLLGHTGRISAVACTTLADGTKVAVTGGRDGILRVWNLDLQAPLGISRNPVTSGISAIACTALTDGTVVAVTGGPSGEIQVWDLAQNFRIGISISSMKAAVSAIACATLRDGTVVAVAGDVTGYLHVWDLTYYIRIGAKWPGHAGAVSAIACTALPDGTIAVITGGIDKKVRIWDLDRRIQKGPPFHGNSGPVSAVACSILPNGGVVAIAGGSGRFIRVWDLAGNKTIGDLSRIHPNGIRGAACLNLADGTVAAVTAGSSGLLRVWDVSRAPVGDPRRGHSGTVLALACAILPHGPEVVITGGSDATARVWNLHKGFQIGNPLRGHSGRIVAVACTTLPNGSLAAITGGSDKKVRVWVLTEPAPSRGRLRPSSEPKRVLGGRHSPLGRLLRGHIGGISVLACAKLKHGAAVAVIGSPDGFIQIWDLTERLQIGIPWSAHTGEISALSCTTLLDETVIAVTGGADGYLQAWNLATHAPIGPPLCAHANGVTAMACTILPNGTSITVTGGRDGYVRFWDIACHVEIGFPLPVQSGYIVAIACTTLPDGSTVAISCGRDKTIRVWDLETFRERAEMRYLLPGNPTAIATDGRKRIIVSMDSDVLVFNTFLKTRKQDT